MNYLRIVGVILAVLSSLAIPSDFPLPVRARDVAYANAGGLVLAPGTTCLVQVSGGGAVCSLVHLHLSSDDSRILSCCDPRFYLAAGDRLGISGAGCVHVEFVPPVTYPAESQLPPSIDIRGEFVMYNPSYVFDGVTICSSGCDDFDLDGDVGTDADIAAFFECLADSCPSADFDNDGDVGTDADIAAFFAALAGRCP